MTEMEMLITEVVDVISAQAGLLNDSRLRMFLNWLQAHHRTDSPISPDGLSDFLKTWFKTLSPKGFLWEYHLILTEIDWWRELNEEKFLRISKGSR